MKTLSGLVLVSRSFGARVSALPSLGSFAPNSELNYSGLRSPFPSSQRQGHHPGYNRRSRGQTPLRIPLS